MQEQPPQRSAHTRWYSDELDDKLDDWADDSKHSKADLIERALRDLFDRYRIDSGGHLTLTEENRPQNASDERELLEQMLSNQNEILDALNTPHPVDEEERQKINSQPFGAVGRRAEGGVVQDEDERTDNLGILPSKLIGDWGHDEVIDPDDVDPSNIKQTPEHAGPLMVGAINYLREEEGVRKMDRRELIGKLADVTGYSETGVRDNYLPRLERRGIVRAHPSIDDDIDVSDTIPEGVPLDDDGDAILWSELTPRQRNRYYTDIEDYIDDLGMDWEDDVYYLSDDEWERDVRSVLAEGYELVARSHSSYRSRSGKMTQMERANACRFWLYEVWDEYRGVAEIDPAEVEGVEDKVVQNAAGNFVVVTAQVLKGTGAMDEERKALEMILFD